ncbi:MAG: transcription termination/antitermination protein NusA, partial [Clostridia bacterium]
EKIDVVAWCSDPLEYISRALSPAKVVMVQVNEEEKSARAIVPDDKLSLAIGKAGLNVRLAAKLTEWKIDVKPYSTVQDAIDNFALDEEEVDENVEADAIDNDNVAVNVAEEK